MQCTSCAQKHTQTNDSGRNTCPQAAVPTTQSLRTFYKSRACCGCEAATVCMFGAPHTCLCQGHCVALSPFCPLHAAQGLHRDRDTWHSLHSARCMLRRACIGTGMRGTLFSACCMLRRACIGTGLRGTLWFACCVGPTQGQMSKPCSLHQGHPCGPLLCACSLHQGHCLAHCTRGSPLWATPVRLLTAPGSLPCSLHQRVTPVGHSCALVRCLHTSLLCVA